MHREFSIFVRIPGWLEDSEAEIKVNGNIYEPKPKVGTYIRINRFWKVGDSINVNFPMKYKFLEAHPLILENTNRVAVTRGPLVYCAESDDNPGIDLHNVIIDTDIAALYHYEPDILDGIGLIEVPAKSYGVDPQWDGKLYRSMHNTRQNIVISGENLKLIPYYAWANRQTGQMQVWHRNK
jgi:DUF1680 family protein